MEGILKTYRDPYFHIYLLFLKADLLMASKRLSSSMRLLQKLESLLINRGLEGKMLLKCKYMQAHILS